MSPEPDLLEQCIAKMMAEDLEANRLLVTLAPCWGWYGDDGRYRRIVEGRNPRWYREFCAMYQSNRSRTRRGRKPDTLIKRRHTLRALDEIWEGRIKTEYAQRVYEFVQSETILFIKEHGSDDSHSDYALSEVSNHNLR